MCPPHTLGSMWWGIKIPLARYSGKLIFSGVSGKPLCILKYGEGDNNLQEYRENSLQEIMRIDRY